MGMLLTNVPIEPLVVAQKDFYYITMKKRLCFQLETAVLGDVPRKLLMKRIPNEKE